MAIIFGMLNGLGLPQVIHPHFDGTGLDGFIIGLNDNLCSVTVNINPAIQELRSALDIGPSVDCNMLFQITAHHFCVGITVSHGLVKETAPIIRYMMGWTQTMVSNYCRIKGWQIKAI